MLTKEHQAALAEITDPEERKRFLVEEANSYPVWKHIGGRPLKCTPEIALTIAAKVKESGCYLETACIAAGIGTSTYYRWVEFAQRDYEAGLYPTWEYEDKQGSIYLAFWELLKNAHAIAEVEMLTQIRESPNNFTGRAWVLERTRNGRYAQRQYVQVDKRVTASLELPEAPASTFEAFSEQVDGPGQQALNE